MELQRQVIKPRSRQKMADVDSLRKKFTERSYKHRLNYTTTLRRDKIADTPNWLIKKHDNLLE